MSQKEEFEKSQSIFAGTIVWVFHCVGILFCIWSLVVIGTILVTWKPLFAEVLSKWTVIGIALAILIVGMIWWGGWFPKHRKKYHDRNVIGYEICFWFTDPSGNIAFSINKRSHKTIIEYDRVALLGLVLSLGGKRKHDRHQHSGIVIENRQQLGGCAGWKFSLVSWGDFDGEISQIQTIQVKLTDSDGHTVVLRLPDALRWLEYCSQTDPPESGRWLIRNILKHLTRSVERPVEAREAVEA